MNNLFSPLGIKNIRWEADKSGTQYGGWGLWLKPRDLARFGYLYLKKGVWNGQQLVPSSWVEVSTKSNAVTTWSTGLYGYHIWPFMDGFATRGYMGQDMYIFPEKDLIVVFTAALPYKMADNILDGIVESYVLQALQKSETLLNAVTNGNTTFINKYKRKY